MTPTATRDGLLSRYTTLCQSLAEGVRTLELLLPGVPRPEATPELAVVPLLADSGIDLGTLLVRGAAAADLRLRLAPALDCLRQEIASTDAAARAIELKLLRLANELDFDFSDDPQLSKAVAAATRRAGAAAAWLHVPRSQLTVCALAREPVDPVVQRELDGLPARVAQLVGQLRRPLAINGPGARADRSADCRLLIVPLFIGRGRYPAWLVLLNPLSAPPFGGWQMLPAISMGQAVARRLELDLDRRTGLYNRAGLEAAVRRVDATGGSLILFDVDRLHAINQVHGLAAGDDVIAAIATVLAPPIIPAEALVARMSGGSFTIVLPKLDTEDAVRVANAIQDAIAAIHPGKGGEHEAVTISAGIAEIENFRKPFDRVAVDADFVLKLAKERGRSRIETHKSSNASMIRRQDAVFAAADLREAMRTKQVLLYAQPIVTLNDRHAQPGYELLIRMRDVDGGVLLPGEFIAAAHRYQLMTALDHYVVEHAFGMLEPHRALLQRLQASFSINVSGPSLSDQSFVDHFIDRMKNAKIPAGMITVEVTEQAAVGNLERAEKMMRRLREAGCGIALDDFGIGANSLAYLRSLPATRIKIDGSFVKDMLTNPRSEAAVKGILQLSRGFKLETVAEYVETEGLAQRLRMLGVEKGQGHLFGKPEPLETVLRTLGEKEFEELRDLLA